MNLRGIARLTAAAFATTLLVGALGAPAFAEGEEDTGAILTIEDPVTAADFPTKGCEGIDDGKAVSGTDGWLYGKPKGEFTVTTYGLLYATDDTFGTFYALVLDADGVHQFALDSATTSKLKGADPEKAFATEAAGDEPPLLPPPAGVTGKLADGGGWVKTPASWLIVAGFADTTPVVTNGEFDLVRTCPSATQPAPSASASHPAGGSGGGQLPVTGTNVWILSGVGIALLLAGGLLFMAYRRRSVKFVA
jgi:LPXTG-motif cell wall-anchored protein